MLRGMKLALEPTMTTGFEHAINSRDASSFPQLPPAKVRATAVSNGLSSIRGNWLENTPFDTSITIPSALDYDCYKSRIVISPQQSDYADSYGQTHCIQTDGIYRGRNCEASTHCSRQIECVNCGCIDSWAWNFDGVGNYLCGCCQHRKNRLLQLSNNVPCPGDSSIQVTNTKGSIVQPVKRFRRTLSHLGSRNGTVCSNCKTSQTSLWRRAPEGDVVCNACGLYRKMHGCQRPMAMRKDSIQTRKRRCAKKQRGNLTHLQQQLHHHQSLEPRLGSADVHEHLDAIKHQYSAAPTPYAFFPPPTVGTKPYTVSDELAPSKMQHYGQDFDASYFNNSWSIIPAEVPQSSQHPILNPVPNLDIVQLSYSSD